jgi:hypothetical protein
MKTEYRRRILKGYRKLINNQRLPNFQPLIPGVNKALKKLDFEWLDWNKFMNNGKDNYDEKFVKTKILKRYVSSKIIKQEKYLNHC